MDRPKTSYTQAPDGTCLAYQVFGEGDADLLYLNTGFSQLEVMWELPHYSRFMRRLGAGHRVITFDKRGWGLSERRAPVADLETLSDDLRAVLDAAGSQLAVLLGFGLMGGAPCLVHAAMYPERVRAFIWWGAYARGSWSPDYPWGVTDEQVAESERVWAGWGDEDQAADLMRDVGLASIADDTTLHSWFARLCRCSAAPTEMERHDEAQYALDVRAVLPTIHVPTLVTTRDLPAEAHYPDEARYVAALIPGALVTVLHGEDYPPYLGDQEEVFGAIDRFLDSVDREEAEFDRVLATVLFTDIVGSTRKATELGDTAWTELRGRHDTVVRGLLARYRGEEVETTGDGFLATFDGPARAVRCAQAVCEAVRPLGLEVRAGCHTGEIELLGADVGGIAVHISARVAALAGPSEVLVSSTVKDLVAGSGLVFQDRGEHQLKGIPESWRLYAALSP
jgi:class 3 adenylate cyclase